MSRDSNMMDTSSLIGKTFSTLLNCQQKLSYSISKEMKSYGITRQQFEVLRILHDYASAPMNLNTVKSQLRENVPDISRIVQRLVEKKLIKRERREDDKRNSAISINQAGMDLIRQIEPVLEKKMNDFFNILNKEELEELSRIISKVNQNKG